MKPLRRVAVLGAGTMGSRIAAHLANAGFPVDLLDIVRPDQPNRNAAAIAGIDSAAKQKPVAFFDRRRQALITPGNFDDDLARVSACDWIIEAVAENLEIKRALLDAASPPCAPPAPSVSTNTSGIPLATIAEGFPANSASTSSARTSSIRRAISTSPKSSPAPTPCPKSSTGSPASATSTSARAWCRCKDTPNFIANRIGCFFGATIHQLTERARSHHRRSGRAHRPAHRPPQERQLPPARHHRRSTSGCTSCSNLYEAVPHDPARDLFVVPPVMQRMMDRGWLGEKTGQGFYKRVGKGADKEIHALDRKTMEYHPAQKVRIPSLETVAPHRGPAAASARPGRR